MLQLRQGAIPNLSPSDLRSSIEHLFLLKRFDEALQLSYSALLDLSEDRDLKKKGKAKIQDCTMEIQNVSGELLNLHHRCNRPENCECVCIVSLLVQILYEMGRSQDVIPCVSNFYGDILKTPYDILFLCVNLLVNALNDFMSAKKLLLLVLTQSHLENSHEYRYDLTEEQREVLVELLIFHVLVPLEEIKEASAFLESDYSLPEWKKEGWINYLNTTVDHNLRGKSERDDAHGKSNIDNPDGCKQIDSSNNTNSGTLSWQIMNLVSKSKNMANYFFLALRKNYHSRLGALACSAVLVFATFYLVMLWKNKMVLSSLKNGNSSQNRRMLTTQKRKVKTVKKSIFAGVGELLSEAFTFR